MRIWQRLDEDWVDRAENGGAGSNANRQREHRNGSKAGIAAQPAPRITKVAYEILQPAGAAGIAALFFHLLGTAEGKPRQAARFLGLMALGNQVGSVLIQMKSQLLLELL